ncbi:MAG TPA: HD domain-containing protein [Chloroflexia bacterium]|nr:HD domain-containing protein [Chloroflexia bacterium]
MSARWDWETRLLAEVGPLSLGEGTGHDLAHCLRVRNLALRIAATEGGDCEALAAAALVHDLFRGDPANSDKGKALAFAEAALARAGFPAGSLPAVRACILYHSWSSRDQAEPAPLPSEVYIFRDADRLDALGAWGVARTFAYGGEKGRPTGFDELAGSWDSVDPNAPAASFASSDASSIGHFHDKLLRLGAHMHTPTGRVLAAARHAYLEGFLARLEAEMAGKDSP